MRDHRRHRGVRADAWSMDLLRRPYRGGHPTKGERPHLAADTIASELRHIAAISRLLHPSGPRR
jgi:hypothetical protein